jgi:hypothetical protein
MAATTPRPSGDDIIWWIENTCYIPEGGKVGQPVRLIKFQKDLIRAIYDNPAGTRRAIISFPRKNAKTALRGIPSSLTCSALRSVTISNSGGITNVIHKVKSEHDAERAILSILDAQRRYAPRSRWRSGSHIGGFNSGFDPWSI